MIKIKHLLNTWLIITSTLIFTSCSTTPNEFLTDQPAQESKTVPPNTHIDSAKNTEAAANNDILPPLFHKGHCKCNDDGILDSHHKLIVLDHSKSDNHIHDGEVCIEVDDFSTEAPDGGDPPVYEIPLLICATGTVSKIYINNLPVDFRLDEKNFVKVNLPLGYGDNKIPVKIVGQRGKIKDDYLEFKGTQSLDGPDKSSDE